MKFKEGEMLLVWWLDSEQSDQTWHTLSSAKEVEISLTKAIGFLVEETPEHIVISQCWDDMTEGYEPGVAGLLTIPRGCIEDIVQLYMRKKIAKK